MAAVASGTSGKALACSVLDPAPTLVTGTLTLVAFAANVAVAGTVTAAVLLEMRFTVRPPVGAGAARFSAIFCVARPLIVKLGGAKLSDVITCVAVVPDA